MERATKGEVLPTAMIGSLPPPGWFNLSTHGRPFRLAMADATYNERYTDAVSAMIRDEERAGVDIVTDGDARLDPTVGGSSWPLYPAERLGGVAREPEPRARSIWDRPSDKTRSNVGAGTIFREIEESALAAVVVDKVTRGNLQYTPIWQASQRLTTRPVKFGTPSAEVIYHTMDDRYYRDDKALVLDVADALNEELRELAGAGCAAIQIEAPWITRAFARKGEGVWEPEFYAEIFERTVEGLMEETEVWAHLCWGNSAGQQKNLKVPSYASALELLNEMSCDVITFENADNENRYLEDICSGIKEKKVALGVLSHRTLQIEQPAQVADTIRQALQHLPPERLVLTADCGFGRESMPRRVALYKMVSMVLGTNAVRKEFGLDERRCLAADPGYNFVL